jgi:hypothetical protein
MRRYTELNDMNRTWNLTLLETDEHPTTTLTGVSNDDAAKILRGLMHGPSSADYAHVRAAVDRVHADRHEGSLAA